MMIRNPSIVFSDIDGTIVDGEHHAIPSDAAVLSRVAEKVPICLVSARSPEGIYPVQRGLGITGAMACYSGAYVIGEDGAELFSATIDLEKAVVIKDFIDHALPAVCACTFGYHTWIVDSRDDPRVQREEYFVQAESTECRDLRLAFGEKGVHKFLLMGEPTQIETAQRVVSENYPELVAVRSNPTLCEVMVGGVSKVNAVEVLCEHFGVTTSRAIAFGDGDNDLEMLGAVGVSYAMANASMRVKMAATHECLYTNEQSGVARMLADLYL